MSPTKKTDHFTYRVTWSAEDSEYVGMCAEFPSLSWLAATPEAGLQAFANSFGVSSATCRPRASRCQHLWREALRGEFRVRIPPHVDRSLAMEAAEQGVSLNRLASASCRHNQRAVYTIPHGSFVRCAPVEEALKAASGKFDHVIVARERDDLRLEKLVALCRQLGVRVLTESREQLTLRAQTPPTRALSPWSSPWHLAIEDLFNSCSGHSGRGAAGACVDGSKTRRISELCSA